MNAQRADYDAWCADNPSIVERIHAMVSEWGPMPPEAQRLWQAARRQYLASLTDASDA